MPALPSDVRGVSVGQLECEKTNLPGVIRVVQRHAEQLLGERVLRPLRDAIELRRRRTPNRVDELRMVVVEQREVAAPRGITRVGRRDRPPRLAHGSRKFRARRSGKSVDEQMPAVSQVKYQFPDGIPRRRELAGRGSRRDAVERFANRWAVPRRAHVRLAERAENGSAIGLCAVDTLRHETVLNSLRIRRQWPVRAIVLPVKFSVATECPLESVLTYATSRQIWSSAMRPPHDGMPSGRPSYID